MARLTNDKDELVRLRKFTLQLGTLSIASIKLLDGQVVEGVMRHFQTGSAMHEGHMHWYAEAVIEPLGAGQTVDIDLIDIDSVENVWHERKDAYVAAGLVEIVELPRSLD